MGWGFTHCFGDGSELGVTPCECPHSPDRHRGCSELRVLTALQTSEQTSCVCFDGADDNSLKLQQKKKKKKGSRLVFTKGQRIAAADCLGLCQAPQHRALEEWLLGSKELPAPQAEGPRLCGAGQWELAGGAPHHHITASAQHHQHGEQPCATCVGPASLATETSRSLK